MKISFQWTACVTFVDGREECEVFPVNGPGDRARSEAQGWCHDRNEGNGGRVRDAWISMQVLAGEKDCEQIEDVPGTVEVVLDGL